mgnify:CR=1 FL=1
MINPLGMYIENPVIYERVKLQGVGQGGPNVPGSIIDGRAVGGDSPYNLWWRQVLIPEIWNNRGGWDRGLRGIALGRKSWLFAGSDRGGQRAAAMYSLIVTAKMNDIDPQAWLADVLARITRTRSAYERPWRTVAPRLEPEDWELPREEELR